MSWLSWLWDKVAGNFLWSVILVLLGFLYSKTRNWLLRMWSRIWSWCVATVAKLRRRPAPEVTTPATLPSKRWDAAGVWFLVFAIILLAIWNRKIEHEMVSLNQSMIAMNQGREHDIHDLRVEMTRYVLPRHLSQDQIQRFGKYLAANTQPHEVTIKYLMGDDEAESYASDLAAAFRAGNWFPNMIPLNPGSIKCQPSPQSKPLPFWCITETFPVSRAGASITQSGPNPPQPTTVEDKLHPKPYLSNVIAQALQAADITDADGGSYGFSSNDPVETITVFVGPRKRGTWAVVPAKFRQMPQGPTDLKDDDF